MPNSSRCAALLLVSSLFALSCARRIVRPEVTQNLERSRQLTILAGTEAERIADADARLTRQLNIADHVLGRFSKADALVVLKAAAKTLSDVGRALNDHARISGWVSVAQLSRRASGNELASAATKEALRELEAVPDLGARCQYVIGVAEEVGQSEGEASAVELLIKAGDWARGIVDLEERRRARLAFSTALFNLNAYEAGVTALRAERDPAWSSDMLLALASSPNGAGSSARPEMLLSVQTISSSSASPEEEPAPPPGAAKLRVKYGASLDYSSVFQGAKSSRSSVDHRN